MDGGKICVVLHIGDDDPGHLDVEMLGQTLNEIMAHGARSDDLFHGQSNRVAFRGADPNRKHLLYSAHLGGSQCAFLIWVCDDPMHFKADKIARWFCLCHVLV